MTDRELLENAAKAAGIEIYESTDGTIQSRPVWVFQAGGGMGTMPYEEEWNPLRDDGPALRLAVKLNMELLRSKINDPLPWVSAVVRNTTIHGAEDIGDDPYAATRRAIVRAAATIGKEMK